MAAIKRQMGVLVLGGVMALSSPSSQAAERHYPLTAQQIAADSYLIEGSTEDFTPENGGFIVNSAFIVTGDGVVLIDTGPSLQFGVDLRAVIAKTTDQPIRQVIVTHEHPDHFLGNQAFVPQTLSATEGTIQGITVRGADYTTNMYRLLGDWMRGTDAVIPRQVLSAHQEKIGTHQLQVITLRGHTAADTVIFDQTTGVLYASDLVFHNRAPTTPQATIADWLAALDQLAQIPFTVVVPGHGPVASDQRPIEQTRDWLLWLDQTLRDSAEQGLSAAEVMALPIPPRFQDLALARSEFQRSVVHLYPALVRASLPLVSGAGGKGSATKVE